MRFLLVEDEDPKREHVRTFLNRVIPATEIHLAKSVRSAISNLKSWTPDLLLLDMSLPTFDIAPKETGGRPQGFGGAEVLRYMDRYKMSVPTLVITAYEAFFSEEKKGINLESMDNDLKKSHPNTYRGYIYYNSIYGGWDTKLLDQISHLFPGEVNANINR